MAGMLVCVCLCARSTSTPPILAPVCGLGACAWALVGGAPPFLDSMSGCVCLCARSPCSPQALARVHGARVWVRGLVFTPPILAWVSGCVCLCARSACTPPVLLGCAVRVCVLGFLFWLCPAIHCWVVGVCVFVYALRLCSANPGWGVRCGCVGSGFGFHPAYLSLGVGACVFV